MRNGADEKQQIAVLHIVGSVGPRLFGQAQVALNLAREQQANGLGSAVWCLSGPSEIARASGITGLAGESIAGFACRGPSFVCYSPRMEGAVRGKPGARCDVLHQHGIWTALSRVSNSWRSRWKRPQVLSPHGMLSPAALQVSRWKKRIALALWEQRNLGAADCIQVASTQEAADVRAYGLKQPVAVIPHGVSDAWVGAVGDGAQFREAHGIPPDKRVLFFLSRVHPHKGLPTLIRAMALIAEQLTNWVMVAAGPEEAGHRSELEEMAARMGLGGQVSFIGEIAPEDKHDAFAAADLFVLPSRSENFSFAVVEALATGVPVITTRGTPWSELESRRCGWWVDNNPTAIAAALADAVERSDDEISEMGRRGRELIVENYTWSRVGLMSVELHRWLLGRGPKPSFVVEN